MTRTRGRARPCRMALISGRHPDSCRSRGVQSGTTSARTGIPDGWRLHIAGLTPSLIPADAGNEKAPGPPIRRSGPEIRPRGQARPRIAVQPERKRAKDEAALPRRARAADHQTLPGPGGRVLKAARWFCRPASGRQLLLLGPADQETAQGFARGRPHSATDLTVPENRRPTSSLSWSALLSGD